MLLSGFRRVVFFSVKCIYIYMACDALQGFYRSGKFVFNFNVGQSYPHEPPKVKCETMVYHPNIDLEGNICLNILRFVTHRL